MVRVRAWEQPAMGKWGQAATLICIVQRLVCLASPRFLLSGMIDAGEGWRKVVMKMIMEGPLLWRPFLDPVVKVSSFSEVTVIMGPVCSQARVDDKGHRPDQRSDYPLSGPFSKEKPNGKITMNASATDVALKLKHPIKRLCVEQKQTPRRSHHWVGLLCEEVALFMTSWLWRLNCRDCSSHILIRTSLLLGRGGQRGLLSSMHHCYSQHVCWGGFALCVAGGS